MPARPSRAVVLGGGGLTGIAWLTGMLASLNESGLRLGGADMILGTSAGSVVGAQLAAGRDFARLYNFLGAERVPARAALLHVYRRLPSPDEAALAGLSQRWQELPPTSAENRAAAGRAARAARTMPERAWVGIVGLFLALRRWPGAALAITVVDAEDGARRVLRDADRVGLARAVAASCAVPEAFPPVTLDGRLYIDGGTGSPTNVDLAAGHDVAIVFVDHAAFPTGAGPLSRTALDAELAALRAAGTEVTVVEPDEPSLAAIGELSALDPARIQPAARAGRMQGRAEAARIAAAWAARG